MNGIICIDKPAEMTSFGVVAKVRGILREKKAGHTGTLDPMATGVLPVLLGKATRFLDYLPDSDKRYRARFLLGKTTDTLDVTGTVVSVCEPQVTEAQLCAVLEEFRGVITQLPPMYSAKSVNGKRLYELARSGIEVERTPCTVEIKRLEYGGCSGGEYEIDVCCSKGTYIRSLIDDIGRKLGCGAVMTALRRTGASGFSIEDCVTLDELQRRRDADEDFDSCVIPLEKVFEHDPAVTVSEAQAKRFLNGGALDITRIRQTPPVGVRCTVYSPEGVFLGLAENDGTDLKTIRILPL